jgi:hypothetical protein
MHLVMTRVKITIYRRTQNSEIIVNICDLNLVYYFYESSGCNLYSFFPSLTVLFVVKFSRAYYLLHYSSYSIVLLYCIIIRYYCIVSRRTSCFVLLLSALVALAHLPTLLYFAFLEYFDFVFVICVLTISPLYLSIFLVPLL